MILEVKSADNVLAHQVAHVLSVGAEVSDKLKQDAIASLDETEADTQDCAEKINEILAVLRTSNIIKS